MFEKSHDAGLASLRVIGKRAIVTTDEADYFWCGNQKTTVFANHHHDAPEMARATFRRRVGTRRLSMPHEVRDLQPLVRRQPQKFEARPDAATVSHNSYRSQRILAQVEIHFNRLPDPQLTLHQRAKTAFTDVETDAPCRLNSARHQVTQDYRHAAQRTQMSSHGCIRVLGSALSLILASHRNPPGFAALRSNRPQDHRRQPEPGLLWVSANPPEAPLEPARNSREAGHKMQTKPSPSWAKDDCDTVSGPRRPVSFPDFLHPPKTGMARLGCSRLRLTLSALRANDVIFYLAL